MPFDFPFDHLRDPGIRFHGMQVFSTYIPMRDGVRLAADIYLPANLPRGERLPTLLQQSRYWRSMDLQPPFRWFFRGSGDAAPPLRSARMFYAQRGYAQVIVDVRGTGASFGAWRMPWETITVLDSIDLLQWICTQPWSDGRVAGLGVSYLGTTAELLLASGHPAVRAVVPQFNHPDPFVDIGFPGGLMNERFVCAWGELDEALDRNALPASFGRLLRIAGKGVKPVDGSHGADWLAQALREHAHNSRVTAIQGDITFRDQPIPPYGYRSDEQAVIQYRDVMVSAEVPVLGIASWMDAGTAGAAIRRFHSYAGIQQVMIGAWNHGGVSQSSPYLPDKAPLSPPSAVQRLLILNFLEACLRQPEPGTRLQNLALTYVLGKESWEQHPTWPPASVRNEAWFFGSQHRLLPIPSTEKGEDLFTVDYRHTTGIYNRWWELGVLQSQRVDTTGRELQRDRVLAYESDPLERDLEIAGWPVVTLKLISTEPDCAFYAYLEDVLPDGRIVGLTEGQLRAVHRRILPQPAPGLRVQADHSFRQADAQPLIPGEPAEITFTLLPVAALLRKGHRLRVALAGHDEGTFPRVPTQNAPSWRIQWGSQISLPVKTGSGRVGRVSE